MYWKHLFTFTAVPFLLVACQGSISSPYRDIQLTETRQLSLLPVGRYDDVAWFQAQLLAFVYTPLDKLSPSSFPSRWERKVILYDLSNDEWQELDLPASKACSVSWATVLERLPEGRLGFLYHCISDDPKYHGITLTIWDPHQDTFHAVQFYPAPFVAGPYSFAPDMSKLIQENAVGAGLNNELYWVAEGGELERLFPNWQRVSTPSWSPDGTRIAFAGTEAYPDGSSDQFTTFREIEGLARYPWSLYLMDADGTNPLAIFSAVEMGWPLWFPDGRRLTFGGRVQEDEGIWILDISTKQLTRVWSSRHGYVLSPDGLQMVLLQRTQLGDIEVHQPTIVNLPEELLSPSDQ